MPNLLSVGKILDLKTQVLEGNLSDVYKFLNEQGYSYAGWARGLSDMNFMTGIAVMGVGLFDCNNFSPAKLLNIKADMTWIYLNGLEKFYSEDKTIRTREDITSTEALSLYETVLNKHNLSIEHWSLYAPLKIIKTLETTEVLENYWNYVRDENANGSIYGLGANLITLAYIHKQSRSNDFKISICAQNWLYHLPGMCTADDIDDAFNNLWKSEKSEKKIELTKMMHMMGLEIYDHIRDVSVDDFDTYTKNLQKNFGIKTENKYFPTLSKIKEKISDDGKEKNKINSSDEICNPLHMMINKSNNEKLSKTEAPEIKKKNKRDPDIRFNQKNNPPHKDSGSDDDCEPEMV